LASIKTIFMNKNNLHKENKDNHSCKMFVILWVPLLARSL
jgi:hypothetical protein